MYRNRSSVLIVRETQRMTGKFLAAKIAGNYMALLLSQLT